MIRVIAKPSCPPEIDINLDRQPSIYLDNDSLIELAKPGARRTRFLKAFEQKGTLLFSSANSFDLAGPQGGTIDRVEEFLDALGPYWIPLEYNPYTVMDREDGKVSFDGTPCISRGLTEAYFQARMKETKGVVPLDENLFRLGRIARWMQHDREDTLAGNEEIKAAVSRKVARYREEYVKDPGNFDIRYPIQLFDKARPAGFVLRELMRIIAKQAKSHTWMPNDGMDFVHAVVSAAYSDFVLLDRQWAERVRALPLPPNHTRVYYRYEIDQFLAAFEQCVIVPPNVD